MPMPATAGADEVRHLRHVEMEAVVQLRLRLALEPIPYRLFGVTAAELVCKWKNEITFPATI
jgi:hypothetical protein